ncbi:prepilin-type N-terminal cleavage/methylation domain-containing protein [Candidatus Peregrinibacteria bacterium]|nr:prepilin-type N-terminal cleavage/methylation domain-containing protein [Candidatus Peregrinibacteria bacterium]
MPKVKSQISTVNCQMSKVKCANGFSLVELLIAVAIIAIISVGSMASFSLVGDIVRVKQGAGLIQDIIHQMDGQALRGEYQKMTVHFLTNYLVIEYEPKGLESNLLKWDSNNITATQGGNLYKSDSAGRQISINVVPAGSVQNLDTNFRNAKEDGWQFQLKNGNQFSEIIALRHFNVNRDSQQTNLLSLDPNTVILTVEAPYAKHSVSGGNTLKMHDAKANKEETIEIK